MRNLDVTTLRSFVAVAELGGVTRAAAHLNLTQSAVSMQLKRLEELLALNLFDRSGRRIALTLNGEQLLSYAKRMVHLNDEVMMRLTDQAFEGEVILGAPHDIVYPTIPQVLKAYNAAFPRVKITLRSSSTVKLHEALDRGEVDLILTTEEDVDDGGETLTFFGLNEIYINPYTAEIMGIEKASEVGALGRIDEAFVSRGVRDRLLALFDLPLGNPELSRNVRLTLLDDGGEGRDHRNSLLEQESDGLRGHRATMLDAVHTKASDSLNARVVRCMSGNR